MSVRSFMSGLSRLGQGDIEQAIAYHETIAKFPRDLASIQGQYHYFYLGQRESAANCRKVLPNRENHYLHGMIAFGLVPPPGRG